MIDNAYIRLVLDLKTLRFLARGGPPGAGFLAGGGPPGACFSVEEDLRSFLCSGEWWPDRLKMSAEDVLGPGNAGSSSGSNTPWLGKAWMSDWSGRGPTTWPQPPHTEDSGDLDLQYCSSVLHLFNSCSIVLNLRLVSSVFLSYSSSLEAYSRICFCWSAILSLQHRNSLRIWLSW